LKWRVEKLQYYYYCYGDSAVIDSVEGTGHSTVKKQSITRGSIFFNKKIGPQLLLSIFEKFFTGARLNDILLNHKVNSVTVSQLFFDCQMLMLSDYERYNLDPPLGSDPRCHHLQIDESKLGKRKHHRERRVEGIWVLGIVEALIPERERDRTYRYVDRTHGINEIRYHFKAGRRIFITVPNRSAATLLPIIYRYCARGSVIRSDGWRAYRGLHHERPVVSTDADFDAGGLFFRAHQVVNHSRGFATVDQVRTNPEVSLTPVSGLIHTNIIESL
jgi:hypothetical protein